MWQQQGPADAFAAVELSPVRMRWPCRTSPCTWSPVSNRDRSITVTSTKVIVTDIDQWQSTASAADREGFQRRVAEVSIGKAGHRARFRRVNLERTRVTQPGQVTDLPFRGVK
jgi:hypothetical protein